MTEEERAFVRERNRLSTIQRCHTEPSERRAARLEDTRLRTQQSHANLLQRALNPPGKTLNAVFTLCQEDAFARTLLYSEVPSYYMWNETKKVFIRRRRGEPVIFRKNTIGRLYTVAS
ncbi:uncharacterized protein TNIN_261001 [Trichonephila inaurata madagascariensis]|uniref:Uncharacterized protein n=1 Tax=Trichonephila inaurata madagascariensis TaxID=2747483 RepID=A0A8X6X8J6_9ARAC|nr:uncharacterized protein TNIN_261001 [Trichonephila inaurata madagascariensis]